MKEDGKNHIDEAPDSSVKARRDAIKRILLTMSAVSLPSIFWSCGKDPASNLYSSSIYSSVYNSGSYSSSYNSGGYSSSYSSDYSSGYSSQYSSGYDSQYSSSYSSGYSSSYSSGYSSYSSYGEYVSYYASVYMDWGNR